MLQRILLLALTSPVLVVFQTLLCFTMRVAQKRDRSPLPELAESGRRLLLADRISSTAGGQLLRTVRVDRLIVFLIAGSLTAGCSTVVRTADRVMNPVERSGPYNVPEELDRFHGTLLVADLHADTLMLDRGGIYGMQRRQSVGHADVPRLMDGNVGFQVLTVASVTPVPYIVQFNGGPVNGIAALAMAQGWPRDTWTSPRARALYQATKWRANTAGPDLVPIRNRKDFESFLELRYRETTQGIWTNSAFRRRPVATLLGLEGAHAFELKADATDAQIRARVDEFWNAGFRSFALTHRFNNNLAGASEGSSDRGLTPLGRRVLAVLVDRGAIIDLAHASSNTISEVLDAAPSAPVWISHTGVHLPDLPSGNAQPKRQTSIKDAQAIANRNGLVGIGLWPEAAGASDVTWVANMISGCVQRIGVDAVCLGSDMDGAVKAAFDASGWPLLTQELKSRALRDEDIRKIMGSNVARFLLQNLPEE